MQKFKIFLFIAFAACIFNVSANERIALVIGNSKYEQLSSLENPRNDANAVAQKFKNMGYQTTLIHDGTDKAIKRELKLFSNGSEKAKVAVVYYAGHGAQVEGENYILPTDLELPNSETDIKLSSIKVDDIINAIKSKTKIIFLDACRDNPAMFKNLEKGRGGNQRGLAQQKSAYQVEESGGVFIAYATDSGNISEDGPKNGNSPFTAAFLKFSGEPISIDDAFTKITNEVKKTTNQKQRPFKYASMDGIICLNPACNLNSNATSDFETTKNTAQIKAASLTSNIWLEKNWAYMGATESTNEFFYVDTSSVEIKGTKVKLKTINFKLDRNLESEPEFFNVVEQVFDCKTRKTFIYEGITFDKAGNKKSGYLSGDWLISEPTNENVKGTVGFALSNIACNYEQKMMHDIKFKKWKKFYGFENQSWFYEIIDTKKSFEDLSIVLKIDYDPELDSKSDKNTVYPQLKGYKYAPKITSTIMPVKINCKLKKISNFLEINFNNENIVFISPPFSDLNFDYKVTDVQSAFGILDKLICEKK